MLQIPGFGGLVALKSAANSRIWGTQILALKVLQIPGFGLVAAANSSLGVSLKVLQIPAFGGLLALKML